MSLFSSISLSKSKNPEIIENTNALPFLNSTRKNIIYSLAWITAFIASVENSSNAQEYIVSADHTPSVEEEFYVDSWETPVTTNKVINGGFSNVSYSNDFEYQTLREEEKQKKLHKDILKLERELEGEYKKQLTVQEINEKKREAIREMPLVTSVVAKNAVAVSIANDYSGSGFILDYDVEKFPHICPEGYSLILTTVHDKNLVKFGTEVTVSYIDYENEEIKDGEVLKADGFVVTNQLSSSGSELTAVIVKFNPNHFKDGIIVKLPYAKEKYPVIFGESLVVGGFQWPGLSINHKINNQDNKLSEALTFTPAVTRVLSPHEYGDLKNERDNKFYSEDKRNVGQSGGQLVNDQSVIVGMTEMSSTNKLSSYYYTSLDKLANYDEKLFDGHTSIPSWLRGTKFQTVSISSNEFEPFLKIVNDTCAEEFSKTDVELPIDPSIISKQDAQAMLKETLKTIRKHYKDFENKDEIDKKGREFLKAILQNFKE